MHRIKIVCLRQIQLRTGKDIVRESIDKMKNGKAVGPSRFVSVMIKSAGEEEITITTLINQIVVEGVISAEWEFSSIVNSHKRKRNPLERKLKATEFNISDSENNSESYQEVDKTTGSVKLDVV